MNLWSDISWWSWIYLFSYSCNNFHWSGPEGEAEAVVPGHPGPAVDLQPQGELQQQEKLRQTGWAYRIIYDRL